MSHWQGLLLRNADVACHSASRLIIFHGSETGRAEMQIFLGGDGAGCWRVSH